MEERYEILKAMNTLVKATANGEFYHLHWQWRVDKDVTDEELRDIAANDMAKFEDMVTCFIRYFGECNNGDGLYVGGEIWGNR